MTGARIAPVFQSRGVAAHLLLAVGFGPTWASEPDRPLRHIPRRLERRPGFQGTVNPDPERSQGLSPGPQSAAFGRSLPPFSSCGPVEYMPGTNRALVRFWLTFAA